MDTELFVAAVAPCICNSEKVKIPFHKQYWTSIPKNFLIPNTTGMVRDNLLEGIDIPFIRNVFDLSEVRLRVPNGITFMLNTGCVTDCVYCYADRPVIQTPLPFERIRTLLKEAYHLGMSYVEVDGGDFFMYPHWREMLAEMRRYDYVPMISTKCPITQTIVENLKSLGIRRIQLSLDSVDSAELQRMLHVDDRYLRKVLQGLRLLDEAGFEITVKPVITRFNDSEESLNRTLDTLAAFGSVRRVNFTPAAYSQFKPATYFSTHDQLARLKTLVEERNRSSAAELSFLSCCEPQTVEQRFRVFRAP